MPARAQAARRRGRSRDPRRARPARCPARSPSGRFEHGRLARARRAHQIDRHDTPLAEVLAVVRRRPLVAGENSFVHVHRHELGVAASTGVAHHGTSISIRSSMISSPAARRAGAPHRAQRNIVPAPHVARRSRDTPSAPGHSATSSSRRLADRALAKCRVRGRQQLDVHARQLPDTHRQPVHGGSMTRARLGLHAFDQGLNDRVLVH